jgi:hypothetical protein
VLCSYWPAVICSSHTFPSEGSPNHQPSSKDDSRVGLGAEVKAVRILPDLPQACGTSNKCGADDRSSNGSGLKDRAGCRYSCLPKCVFLKQPVQRNGVT